MNTLTGKSLQQIQFNYHYPLFEGREKQSTCAVVAWHCIPCCFACYGICILHLAGSIDTMPWHFSLCHGIAHCAMAFSLHIVRLHCVLHCASWQHIFLCVVALRIVLPLQFLSCHGIFHHAASCCNFGNGICTSYMVWASKLCLWVLQLWWCCCLFTL